MQADGKIVVGGWFIDFNNTEKLSLFRLQETSKVARTPFDFDGDRKADVSIFRPSNGVWYLQQSLNGFAGIAFGASTDKIVPADFDGDNKADVAVFRPSNGVWYIQGSQSGFIGTAFG